MIAQDSLVARFKRHLIGLLIVHLGNEMRLRFATWMTFLTCTQYHTSQGQLSEVTTPLAVRT